MREKEGYRENLERIHTRFPNKELLTKKDVASFLGCNYRYVTKRFPFKDNFISKATLARELC